MATRAGRADGAAVLLLSVLVAVGMAGGSLARAGLMARVMGVPHVLCAAEDRFLPRFGVLREAALLHWHQTGWLLAQVGRIGWLVRRIG